MIRRIIEIDKEMVKKADDGRYPKLGTVDYSENLTDFFRNNDIKSITIVRMNVLFCGEIIVVMFQNINHQPSLLHDIPFHFFVIQYIVWKKDVYNVFPYNFEGKQSFLPLVSRILRIFFVNVAITVLKDIKSNLFHTITILF